MTHWFYDKFLPWWRKWWKWIVFPVGILSATVTLLVGSRNTIEVAPDVDSLNESMKERDDKISEADKLRDEKLKELADENKERLEKLSASQENELLDLADKPIEEVVKWFDKL